MTFQSRAMVEQVRGMATRIAASEGLELVDTEWKGGSRGGTLRVFIDKENGVTHADCEKFSRQLSAVLDVEDLIPNAYSLEVSSPGLDRKLTKVADFQRFTGRTVKVRVREPLHGSRHVTGRIEGSSNGAVSLRTGSGETRDVQLADVELARLVVEI